jgi:flagellar hook-associated protein 2
MPAIDGIVSGIDTSGLIDAITSTATIPLQQMEEQLDTFEDQKEKIAGLSNRLKDLSSFLKDMDTLEEFSQFTATTDEDSPFTLSATDEAISGTYDVEVVSLASNETEVSTTGWATADEAGAFGHGELSIDYGGAVTQITVDATNDDPSSVAAAISAIDGVNAYVLDTGDGGTPFQLVIQSENSGASNTITVDTSALTGNQPLFTETRSAANSEISVNGTTIYSETNTVTALPGLTINLTEDDPGQEHTLTVSRDQTAIEADVQQFVDLYNEFVNYYDSASVYNSELGITGALASDATARRVVDGMADMVSSPYTVDGNFEIFAQIGIQTQQDGTLELDTEVLSDALTNNFDDVAALFNDENGPAQTIITKIDDLYVDEDTGSLQSRTDSLEDSIEDQQVRIEQQQVYIDNYVARLRAKFTAMEIAMSNFQNTSMYLGAMFASAAPTNTTT